MRKLLKAGLVIMLVVAAPRIMGGGEKYSPDRRAQAFDEVRRILEREYDLKPKFVKGQKRYYRLWMTIENFDDYGHVAERIQWRGDLERVVTSVDPAGRAEEKITWKSLGFRNWLMSEGRYSPHQVASWAEGFSYTFSMEDDYEDLNWDFSEIPKNMLGFVFVGAVQISAHAEYDFLRSSRHASIEKLRRVGDLMNDLPEEGTIFDLDFPPVFTNSKLVRKNVRVGFLGLTLANGEPCALIDYQQGPQPFTWTMEMGPPIQPQPVTVNTELTSRQSGIFVVRLSDGSLVNGEFTERTQQKITPVGGEPSAVSGQGMWAIREITPEEFERGLTDWAEEQTPTPQLRPVLTAAVRKRGEEGIMGNIGVNTHPDGMAHQQFGGLLQQSYLVKPKAGMVQEFEKAYAKHLAWHREQNDSWIWETQQIVSGEYFGQYIIITPDHRWADYDNPRVPSDEHRAHFLSTVGQYVESISSSFWILLPKVSRFRETQEPFSILSAINFQIHQGKTDEFLDAVEKVYKAVEKTGWPLHYFWAAQVTGGQQPTYTIVFTPQNWAGLAPPEKSFRDLLVEAYGEQEAEAILKVFDKTVKSQSSQISVDRPDLRYFPGQGM